MPRPLSAPLQSAIQAERTAEVIAYLLTISSQKSYEKAVLKSKPVGYWRLGENVGQTTAWDASGNGRHGTYVGGVTLGQEAGMLDDDKAALFDGVDDKVDIAYAPTWTAFTLELRLNKTAQDGSHDGLISSNRFRFQAQASGGGYTVYWQNLQTEQITTTSVLAFGAWSHVVFTRDAVGTVRLYVNGILDTGPAVLTSGALAITALRIGSDGLSGIGGVDAFAGLLDDIAFYDHALPAIEIADHYAALSLPTIPTLRFTDHKPDVVSRGRTYLSLPFEAIPPADDEDTPATMRLRISNVARRITEGIRSLDDPLLVVAEQIRVADPDVVEISMPKLLLMHATATVFSVEGDLIAKNPLAQDRRYPKGRYTPAVFPGLF